MLVITYIASMACGFVNFYQYNTGRKILGNFMLKAAFHFILALVFCFLQCKGFASGEVTFTVKNIFVMSFLVFFHFNLWINAEVDCFDMFAEKSFCMVLFAFVSALAFRLIFTSVFI